MKRLAPALPLFVFLAGCASEPPPPAPTYKEQLAAATPITRDARAAADSGDPRERDLGRYALRRLGVEVEPPSALEEPRPTLALLRSGNDDGGLKAAAAADPLVRHLARLDPELAPLLTR